MDWSGQGSLLNDSSILVVIGYQVHCEDEKIRLQISDGTPNVESEPSMFFFLFFSFLREGKINGTRIDLKNVDENCFCTTLLRGLICFAYEPAYLFPFLFLLHM